MNNTLISFLLLMIFLGFGLQSCEAYFEENDISIYENWNEMTGDNYRKYNIEETSGCLFN